MTTPVVHANGNLAYPAGTLANSTFNRGVTVTLAVQNPGAFASIGWSLRRVPDSSTAAVSAATGTSVTITLDKPARYTLRCIGYDAQGVALGSVVAYLYAQTTSRLRYVTEDEDVRTASTEFRTAQQAVVEQLDGLVATASQTQHVPDVATLRAAVPEANAGAILAGRTTRGDGGEGLWYIDTSGDPADDDGGQVIAASGGGVWRRIRGPVVEAGWYGADPTGVADSYDAIVRATNACLVAATNPETTTRTAKATLFFRRGTYRTTRPAQFHSIVGLRVVFEDRQTTSLQIDDTAHYNRTDNIAPCVVDVNGCAYCTFENVGVYTYGSSEVRYGILLRWRRAGESPATEPSEGALFPTTNNTLRYVGVSGKFRDAGIQIGSPGNNLQEDQTQLWAPRVQGGYNPEIETTSDTYWQHGIRFGTGVSGNNLIHKAFWLDATHCRYGVKVWSTNVSIDGGIIQSNDIDLLFTQPIGYCRVSSIRSEGSRRFIHATNSGSVQCAVEITNSTFGLQADADYHTLDGVVGRWVQWDTAGTVILRGVTAFGGNPQSALVPFRPTMAFQQLNGLTAILEGVAVNDGRVEDIIGLNQVVIHLRGYTQTSSGSAVVSTRGPTTLVGSAAPDGKMGFGYTDGSGSGIDTYLYREAAGTLRTDGAFKLAGTYASPLWLGGVALWADGSGNLRIKVGTPSGDTDGTVVGSQS